MIFHLFRVFTCIRLDDSLLSDDSPAVPTFSVVNCCKLQHALKIATFFVPALQLSL